MNSFYKRKFALLLIISIVVIAVLTVVAAVIGVNMFGYDFKGSGTEDDPYLIESDADMKALSVMSSTGDNVYTEGKYYKLTRDVKVYGANRNKSLNGFSGVFDGDGHTVEIVGAMFNKLADTAVIRNATLKFDYTVAVDFKTDLTKDFSYIAHYASAGAVIENVAVDYKIDVVSKRATDAKYIKSIGSTYLLLRSDSSAKLIDSSVDMDIKISGGYVSACYVGLKPLGGIVLERCDVGMEINAETGAGARIEFEMSSVSCTVDCVTNIRVKREKKKQKWKDAETSLDDAFCGSLASMNYNAGSRYKQSELDLNIAYNYIYETPDCIGGVTYYLPTDENIDIDFNATVDHSALETFTQDGFVFAERGDAVYLLEYVGDKEEANVPSFDGKYKSYCVNSFAFYNKDPRKIVYPADITAIGGKPYGDNISVVVYRGTMKQYRNISTAYNLPDCPIVCSDGNYRPY